jgi:preprotein translocase subunit SecG
MGKKIRGVKLKASDINRNNGKDISHTINKIKANERRYTIILVIVFIIIFLVIGYSALKSEVKKIYNNDSNLVIKSPLIKLSSGDVLSDEVGLKRENIKLKVSNNTGVDLNYRIVLKEDLDSKKKCGCDSNSFNIKNISYSLDGKTVRMFNNDLNVITTGMLKSYKTDNVNIKIWLNNIDNKDSHFHGKFIVENMKIEE